MSKTRHFHLTLRQASFLGQKHRIPIIMAMRGLTTASDNSPPDGSTADPASEPGLLSVRIYLPVLCAPKEPAMLRLPSVAPKVPAKDFGCST